MVGDGHVERVLVDKSRVAQPIRDGVALSRCLNEEGVGGVEVQALYLWQDGVTVAII